MTKIVVVGGDAAGATAASVAKRRQPEWDVVVLERGEITSYAACGLPYWLAGQIPQRESLIARTPERHRANGLDVRTGATAVGIDVAAGTVRVRSGDHEYDEGYDHLVLATGANPIVPPIPGADAPNVGVVHTVPGSQRILDEIEAGARRAVVVGGGFIGIEMAEAFTDRGIAVTVLDLAPAPMTVLDPDMSAEVATMMAANGIDCAFGQPAREIELDSRGRAVAVRTDADRYPCDLVVLAVGMRPASDLAAGAGLPLGRAGGILVDRRQRVRGQANIWAAGDCSLTYHRLLREDVPVPLGTHANKQGRVAGTAITGGSLTFPGVIGTAITKVGTCHIGRTGLTEAEAAAAGFATSTGRATTNVIAHYMPDHGTMTTKVVAESGTGRLLGGQIVGDQPGAAKRIDTLATAIWNCMTAEELVGMDLSYAPPFSPVWDPVQTAARLVR